MQFPFRAFLFISLFCISNHFCFGATLGFSGDQVEIKSIQIENNKITKDQIILRELEFELNKTYEKEHLTSLIKRSKENLLNTLLFNFIELNGIICNKFLGGSPL